MYFTQQAWSPEKVETKTTYLADNMRACAEKLLMLFLGSACASCGIDASPSRTWLPSTSPYLRESVKIALHLRGGSDEAAGAAEAAPARKVVVTFVVECDQTKKSESIGITGGCRELGSWKDITVMSPENWPKWELPVTMHEIYPNIEYKYVKVNTEGVVVQWEPAGNRRISLQSSNSIVVADGTWADTAAYINEAKIAKNLVPGCAMRSYSLESLNRQTDRAQLEPSQLQLQQQLRQEEKGLQAGGGEEEGREKDGDLEINRQLIPGLPGSGASRDSGEEAATSPPKKHTIRQTVPGCNKVKQLVPGLM